MRKFFSVVPLLVQQMILQLNIEKIVRRHLPYGLSPPNAPNGKAAQDLLVLRTKKFLGGMVGADTSGSVDCGAPDMG